MCINVNYIGRGHIRVQIQIRGHNPVCHSSINSRLDAAVKNFFLKPTFYEESHSKRRSQSLMGRIPVINTKCSEEGKKS